MSQWQTLAAIAAPLIAALAAYLLAARKMSGKVTTSEASQLWAESDKIRQDYRSRIAQLEERIMFLEAALEDARRENTRLRIRLGEINGE